MSDMGASTGGNASGESIDKDSAAPVSQATPISLSNTAGSSPAMTVGATDATNPDASGQGSSADRPFALDELLQNLSGNSINDNPDPSPPSGRDSSTFFNKNTPLMRPTSPPRPTTNLEAYILRPVCRDLYRVVEWSYTIDLLPLKDRDIRVHVSKLGLSYSVIESIAELLPLQLTLINTHVETRSGELVSVQYAKSSDLVTMMGTFKVQSVIFVLRSPLPRALDRQSAPVGTLFGQNTNTFGKSFAGFGGIPNSTQPPFGGHTAANTLPSDRIAEVTKALKERGEEVYHVEVGDSMSDTVFVYQTMTSAPSYWNSSLEEHRALNYASGWVPLRRIPFPVNFSGGRFEHHSEGGQADSSSSLFGTKLAVPSGGFFGFSPAVIPAPGGRLFGPTPAATSGSFFGSPQSVTPSTGGGLFGAGPTPTSGSSFSFSHVTAPSPSGGLFGNLSGGQRNATPSSTSGGLFGTKTTPASGNLFGSQQSAAGASNSGGLFESKPSLFKTSHKANLPPLGGLFATPAPANQAPGSGIFSGGFGSHTSPGGQTGGQASTLFSNGFGSSNDDLPTPKKECTTCHIDISCHDIPCRDSNECQNCDKAQVGPPTCLSCLAGKYLHKGPHNALSSEEPYDL
ncbi:hypothetical protein P154DRAFT_353525 [Amniculicola lignicola CBS 123094]|uniref:Uncharacterized protein n=1 Tax=Amniculicola lignicola CBS 123094 TaxID=1392246 RepID=A0A6A5WTV3_9PLEO|nr:hypothetical protein P154DRAFT_353525 [Amniculicola lignicola CBS 123094]